MSYEKRTRLHLILQLLCFLLLIAADQGTKLLAYKDLREQPDIELIRNVFYLHYLENRGAAFGIFQGKTWIFYVLTIVILAALILCYIRIRHQLKRYPAVSKASFNEKTARNMILLGYGLVVLGAGAAGNLIDRIVRGFVVDFLDVRAIGFPVFNLADICVTISCIFIVIFFLLLYKEDEYFRILPQRSKDRGSAS